MRLTALDGRPSHPGLWDGTQTCRLVYAADPVPVGTRDASTYPFASTSVINTAIGSGATFEASTDTMTAALVGGSAAGYINRSNASFTYAATSLTDPLVTIAHPTSGAVLGYFRVPVDATSAGPDNWLAIVQPDGRTLVECYAMLKTDDTHWTSTFLVLNDLKSSGMSRGARASQTSQMAGVIRAQELVDGSIRHALTIGLTNDQLKTGYVWPANAQDSDAASLYKGVIPMGTLFAIPGTVDVTTLGLASSEALAVARALQDYGAYVLVRGNASGYTSNLYADYSTEEPRVNRARAGWSTLLPYLRRVTNSAAATPGGGGTPRQPLLPEVLTGVDRALNPPVGPATGLAAESGAPLTTESGDPIAT